MRRRIKLWCNQMEKILEQSGAMYFFIDFITVYSRFVSRWPFLCFRQVCTSWCCQNIIKLALATKNNKFYINIMVFANVRNRQRLSRYSVVVVFETNQPQPGWVTIVAMFSFLYKKQGVSLTFIIILLFIGFSFLVKMNGKVQDKIDPDTAFGSRGFTVQLWGVKTHLSPEAVPSTQLWTTRQRHVPCDFAAVQLNSESFREQILNMYSPPP